MPEKRKKTGLSATTKWHRKNPGARKKMASYNKPLSEDRKKKKVESQKKRRAAKRAGKNIKGKDYDHSTRKFESRTKNRSRKTKTPAKRLGNVKHKRKTTTRRKK